MHHDQKLSRFQSNFTTNNLHPDKQVIAATDKEPVSSLSSDSLKFSINNDGLFELEVRQFIYFEAAMLDGCKNI